MAIGFDAISSALNRSLCSSLNSSWGLRMPLDRQTTSNKSRMKAAPL